MARCWSQVQSACSSVLPHSSFSITAFGHLQYWSRNNLFLKNKQGKVKRGTPKALANSSPGLLQPWVHVEREEETLKAFDRDEPFQGL
jgi:hypothetical protein